MDKMEIKTHEDGWDCIPELREAVEDLEAIDTFKYEIKNCVRVSSLDDMMYEMKDILINVLEKLDEIDTEVEYRTVKDND